MKKLLILCLLGSFSLSCYSQNEDVKLVIGLEGGYIFHSLNSNSRFNWNYSYGLIIDYPVKKFSLGIGFLKVNYGERFYQGNVTDIRERPLIFYHYYRGLRPEYFVVSNRIQYRLPCNCVYLHAAYNLEFYQGGNAPAFPEQSPESHVGPYKPREATELKDINTSIEFGIGFKLHINHRLRILMRPTYQITRRPLKRSNPFYKDQIHYLRMTMGIQLGIG